MERTPSMVCGVAATLRTPLSGRRRSCARSSDGAERPESIAAFGQQHLAVAGQDQPAPDAIEQRDAEIGFKILDLARQRGLRDAELCRRFRDRAEVRDGHERTQMPEVHVSASCRNGMKFSPIIYWTQEQGEPNIAAAGELTGARHEAGSDGNGCSELCFRLRRSGGAILAGKAAEGGRALRGRKLDRHRASRGVRAALATARPDHRRGKSNRRRRNDRSRVGGEVGA